MGEVPDGPVVNHVQDVHGNVVQARDIYGDVHFGPPPPFRIEPWSAVPTPLPAVPHRQPSLLLNAAGRVVPFGGRAGELRELASWRDANPRLSVLLLHGPGGQGKTRLAARFAELSGDAGWAVFAARDSPGSAAKPAGDVLVLVDYADRWPYRHLAALLEGLADRDGRARVLLIARTAGWWQAVAGKAENLGWQVDALPLDALAEHDRAPAFTTARDRFGEVLGAPTSDGPPTSLSGRAFGSVLTLHMAALVTVMEARERTTGVPTDPEGMAAYLLRREHRGWRELAERDGFRTDPADLQRVVAAAVLAGPVPGHRGEALLDGLRLPSSASTLRDHRSCYPPHNPTEVLEPLYPDRLAEDFLALLLPGHRARGFDAEPWTPTLLTALAALELDGTPANRRTLTVLTAAAERWPHVVPRIADLLHAHPEVAVREGGAALEALAATPVDDAALRAVESTFPPGSDVDLDVGMAAVTERVTTDDPLRLQVLGRRLANAGRLEDAVRAAWRALPDLGDPTEALADLGRWLTALGHREQGLACTRRAEATAGPGRAPTTPTVHPTGAGPQQALAAAREAVAVNQDLVRRNSRAHRPALARSLVTFSALAHDRAAAEEAVVRYRELVSEHPKAHRPALADALANLGHLTGDAQPLEEAVAIYRRLAAVDPLTHERELASAVARLEALKPGSQRWYRRTGRSVDTDALFRRGVRYAEEGKHRKARRHYRKAARSGHAYAMVDLGRLVVGSRPAEAERRWREAVDHGVTAALFDLGALCERQGRLAEAKDWYHRGALAGAPNAMIRLAGLLVRQGDEHAAEEWYREVAGLGDVEGDYGLGALLDDQGTPDKAEPSLTRAAESGHLDAMVRLGDLKARGGDHRTARDWYRRAAVVGHAEAGERLAGGPPSGPPDQHPLTREARRLDIPTFDFSADGAFDLAAALLDQRTGELVEAGDLAGAIEVYREEANGYLRLLGGDVVPPSPRVAGTITFHLAGAFTRMGSLHGRLRQSEPALAHTAAAVALLRRFGRAELRVRSSLAQALRIYAAVRLAAGTELDEAGAAADEAVGLFTELEDEAPDVFTGEALLARQTLDLCRRPHR
ncbi:tetratricopeptide (TPR) repeat protein [Saccharothrix tamanrassetensis]|uniref:Tetratricopeptide (TPR) repeat protein n=1 Tax=Saccharothrix tamanrassetensis TaxID=1051531 RepID=A0A841CPM5_9PSEU|nr:hypothetical protein [Saccharothrix tamanrassetensis]MBB5959249.1 tetratricopeptide (TPR) repeat protein [Saccharothrix tamanrassetensis]